MDYDKLIERLKCPHIHRCQMYDEYPSCKACQRNIQQEATLAIETLRAENEKLRADWGKYQPREHWETLNEAVDNLRADLARVTAERDAAVEQLHGSCPACAHYTPNHNEGTCRTCRFEIARDPGVEATDNWEWRGIAAIEDILVDEYNLDRLRELVEADREQEFQRHLKRFDIMPPKKNALKAREQG